MSYKNKTIISLSALAIALALLAFSTTAPAFAAGEKSGAKKLVVISTGDPRGLYYYCGKRIETMINLGNSDYMALSRPTNGALDNISAVAGKSADFGFSQYDMLIDAAAGALDIKKGDPKDIAVVTVLFPEVFTVVGREPAASVADLSGKTIATHLPGSGVYRNSTQILKAAGLEGKLKRAEMNMKDTEKAFAAGTIDGFFSVIGMPAATITGSLSKVKDSRVMPLGEALRKEALGSIKGFVPYAIPVGTYSNLEEVPTIATFAVVFTRRDTPAPVVENMLKTIYSLPDFSADGVSGKVRYVPRAAAKKFLGSMKGVPVHAAAAKYFEAAEK